MRYGDIFAHTYSSTYVAYLVFPNRVHIIPTIILVPSDSQAEVFRVTYEILFTSTGQLSTKAWRLGVPFAGMRVRKLILTK